MKLANFSKIIVAIIVAAFSFLGISCQEKAKGSGDGSENTVAALKAQADSLAHAFIIVDGHVDLPYRLNNHMEDVSQGTETGDFDYLRAKEGGLDAPFMSIYIPSRYEETGGGMDLADSLMGMVKQIAMDNPDKFALAFSPDDVHRNFEAGKISLPMGLENGTPIHGKLENIDYLYQQGIRYITLTHGKDNHICDSSYDTTRTWGGLSPFGREVVKKMNKTGIMVDVSHISDSAFYEVMAVTTAPVIASHSSCRHFTPGFERNMSNDMIKLLAENGGVIQINFGSTFIDSVSRKKAAASDAAISQYLEENQLSPVSPEAEEYIASYHKKHPIYSDVSVVADHIDHVVNLVGIAHVGLGSDFDGVGDTLPEGLKDVSQYPNLIYELLKRGYSPEDIRKICYENVFRVWNAVKGVAEK